MSASKVIYVIENIGGRVLFAFTTREAAEECIEALTPDPQWQSLFIFKTELYNDFSDLVLPEKPKSS